MVKFSVYLNRLVFVMDTLTSKEYLEYILYTTISQYDLFREVLSKHDLICKTDDILIDIFVISAHCINSQYARLNVVYWPERFPQ